MLDPVSVCHRFEGMCVVQSERRRSKAGKIIVNRRWSVDAGEHLA